MKQIDPKIAAKDWIGRQYYVPHPAGERICYRGVVIGHERRCVGRNLRGRRIAKDFVNFRLIDMRGDRQLRYCVDEVNRARGFIQVSNVRW
jgi:hypothetical protein